MNYRLLLMILLGLAFTAMGADKAYKPSGRALVAAKTLTSAQRAKLLDILNSGDAISLQSLPHIGQSRAGAIIKARPIINLIDLLKVNGIGDQTFVDIIAYARAGFSETQPKAWKHEDDWGS